MRYLLGISAYYHDSAAALLRDGEIVAAAQEERFSRLKNDERFPHGAVRFCLERAGLRASELDAVVFYDKPITKFARILESYLAVAPGGWKTFPQIIPLWLGEKLNLRKTLRDELPDLSSQCELRFVAHHQSHAASAFFPSPFERAAILTVDGVGEWATTSIGQGTGRQIQMLKEIRFPHSLGLLYSAFTAYCGFRVNSGEYKLMGLAPYGQPRFVRHILDQLLDLKEDGSFWLNMDYFDFLRSWRMTNDRFHRLFEGSPRGQHDLIDQRHMDVARSIQVVTEEVMMRLARHTRELTGETNLCLAGGVALNCVANGLIHRSRLFERIWIQPAAGDAGGALGAALAVWHGRQGAGERQVHPEQDAMRGALLGPEFSDAQIRTVLDAQGAVYSRLEDDPLLSFTVDLLRTEKVVGWVQGRMEFGPRALGNRSILADARSRKMQSVLNLKVKFRESFRPFAPLLRRERLTDYFDLDVESPYMLLVAPVLERLRLPVKPDASGFDRLKQPHSVIPAVTHIDNSARIQTVTREQNPKLYGLLQRFEEATGSAVLVNTSFNVRGEPIVCTPADAYRCFVRTEMDYLVLGNYVLERALQPKKDQIKRPGPQED